MTVRLFAGRASLSAQHSAESGDRGHEERIEEHVLSDHDEHDREEGGAQSGQEQVTPIHGIVHPGQQFYYLFN